MIALILAGFSGGCGLTSAGISTPTQTSNPSPVSVSLTPPSGSVLLGETMAFTAIVSNTTNSSVTWSVAGVAGGNSVVGTISAGVFTAPQVLPAPASIMVTATSVADPSKSASATITVTSDVVVGITPSSAGVELGAQQAFTAAITSAGKPRTTVSWLLDGVGCSGNTCGTISPTGIFTAPPIVPLPSTVLLTATSVADPSKSASTAVTITSRLTLTIGGPSSVTVLSAAAFSAVLAPVPGSNPSLVINWTVSGANCTGAACGTISASGSGATATYTAPSVAIGTVSVTATPAADASKAQSMLVAVAQAPSVTISPTAATVILGATTSFTITATGSAGSSVTWDVNGVIGGNATLGTITPNPSNSEFATYAAPQNMPGTNPVSVRASSNANPSATATAQVTLEAPPQISLTPAGASLTAGQRQTFTAQVLNSANTNVTWQVNGVSGGTAQLGQVCVVASNPCEVVTSAAAGSVDYVAPTTVPSANPVTLTAVSQTVPALNASATITILPHITITVSPPSATLAPGTSQLFTAAVAGASNQQVTWTISGAACGGGSSACGTIDPTGLYVAPASAPSPDSFIVVATSSASTTQTGFASVAISTTPTITSLLPSSAVAGAAGGFTLQVGGANFAASSPGPGSTIIVSGTARNTVCGSTLNCSTTLAASDLASAIDLNIVIENPNGTVSNTAAFVIVAPPGSPASIPVTTGSPAATGQDITVVDLSTNGSSAPDQDVSLNVAALGIYLPSTGSCSLGGGAIPLAPPSAGTATTNLCVFSVSGLAPSMLYTLTGSVPADIAIAGAEPLGLGIVQLTLEVPASAGIGARSLLIRNSNLDQAVATGAIDVQ